MTNQGPAQESRWHSHEGPYIIAEAGVNHNGSLSMALDLVRAAAAAGADAVKFQTFVPESVVTAAADPQIYQVDGDDQDLLEQLRSWALDDQSHRQLQSAANSLGLDFLSTAFDLDSLAYLSGLGIPVLKIPSGEITNLPYLQAIARNRLPVIMSTGMADLEEVRQALDVLCDSGLSLNDITVLHCTTSYPASVDSVNLLAMRTMADQLGVAVGYSDHTLGPAVAIAATALGAAVIEKHLTLDVTLPGPDHAASMEPHDFLGMVQSIRDVQIALGDGVKRPHRSEERYIRASRRSIVAAVAIAKGDVFTESNLAVKRPGFGVSGMRWNHIVGSRATRDYAADEMIEE